MTPDRLVVRNIAGKGRGVVAATSYAAGDLIEECPVVVFSREDVGHIEKTLLDHYYYVWDEENAGSGAIVLGYGLLYNHASRPNARYVRDFERLTMSYFAIRDICPGEEITIEYNAGCSDSLPLWFEPAE